MYEGILIDGKVTIRKGRIYRYRCRYELSLSTIKDELVEHKDEVKGKLSKENQKILKVLLNAVEEREDFGYRSPNVEIAVLKPKLFYLLNIDEKRGYMTDEALTKLGVISINRISIDDSGKIDFGFKKKQEIEKYNINDITHNELLKKFEKEISESVKDYVKELQVTINTRKREIKTLRDRAKNLLMLKEIMDTDEVVE